MTPDKIIKEKALKEKIHFLCQECGNSHPKWQGQCAACGEWNSLLEEVIATGRTKQLAESGYAGVQSDIVPLTQIPLEEGARLSTGLGELDRVLGGGLISDSAVLLGGDPGIGKSTLLLQMLMGVAHNCRSLYVTGEESPTQVALRAKRLGLPPTTDLTLLAETRIERILTLAQQFKPTVLVVDSIQTIYTDALTSAAGSPGQVRESAARLIRYVKQTGIALFLIGHVTKDGALAGPRVLEHMVDTVLYFEGQNDSRYRVVRAVKNRFGAANEIGVFAMTDTGLKQVSNPSALFMSQHGQPVPGSTILVTWEGSRPLLVEVQALVDESHLANPRRVTVGLDANRLSMLLAVLHRHGRIATASQDVFVNVVGGLKINETGADLAVLLACLSSLRHVPLPRDLIFFGEVGLAGEIRPVQGGPERLREAAKHGFKRAIVAPGNAPKKPIDGISVVAVERLADAITAAFGDTTSAASS